MEISKVAMLSTLAPPAFNVFQTQSSSFPLKKSNVIKYTPSFLRFRQPHSIACALGQNSGISIRRSEFASVSSSSFDQQNSSVAVNPAPVPPPPSQVGSPLFWVGVGVAFSALFSWLASYLKNYAMKQAFKTMMNQMGTPNNQNANSPFGSGSPFPFPMPPSSGSATSPFSSSSFTPPAPSMASSTQSPPNYASKPSVTVDVPVTQVKEPSLSAPPREFTEKTESPKKYSFVDVSPEDTLPQRSAADLEEFTVPSSSIDASSPKETVYQNGNFPSQTSNTSTNYQTGDTSPLLSLDALEKMLEDPTVQRMVYPYLPEEMRNPSTFKWMLQNPVYRKQLEEMLSNMSGNADWDNRMVDSLKNFDLSSPEVKQQFDQIGLTPEEVISKIMANPEVAMAFQNPKVQQAILDCSQNPMNITKYQNDKEVMDVFEKISELFPGVGGAPR